MVYIVAIGRLFDAAQWNVLRFDCMVFGCKIFIENIYKILYTIRMPPSVWSRLLSRLPESVKIKKMSKGD